MKNIEKDSIAKHIRKKNEPKERKAQKSKQISRKNTVE